MCVEKKMTIHICLQPANKNEESLCSKRNNRTTFGFSENNNHDKNERQIAAEFTERAWWSVEKRLVRLALYRKQCSAEMRGKCNPK